LSFNLAIKSQKLHFQAPDGWAYKMSFSYLLVVAVLMWTTTVTPDATAMYAAAFNIKESNQQDDE